MHEIEKLLEIMQQLRDPENGCPWDLAQTYQTIVPHTLEEAYEVAEAIENGDLTELKDELGDLLFQVVFYSRLAEEEGAFDFAQVADAISHKLIRRHPHVFGDEKILDADTQTQAWERHKQAERDARAGADFPAGLLEGISHALPALSRAQKLQRRAASVGFDWQESQAVLDKIREEVNELQLAMQQGEGQARMEEEMGDILFSCVNLVRHLGMDAEAVLRKANRKFEWRFSQVEKQLSARGGIAQAGSEEMEQAWQASKMKPVQGE